MAVTAVVAMLIYAVLWIGWMQNWTWLAVADQRMLDAGQSGSARYPQWASVWNWFCTLLGPIAFRIIGLGIIIALLVRRHFHDALFVFISVELSGVVIEIAKRTADRPRPGTRMADPYGSSFPSGHALGVLVSVLALLTLFWPTIPAHWRRPLAALGAFVVIAIGVGRVALNVHHPSDVLAGWALGYAYFVLCLAVVRTTVGRPEESDTAQQNSRIRSRR